MNIVMCDGGLANRLNALLFALILRRKFGHEWRIAWPLNNWCGAPLHSLFDAPLPTPVAPAPAAVTPKSAPKERRVVLDPQAAPSARSEPTPTGDDLVFKCGLLFLKQNRVAVSMLQREFGLDFKQATAVLDQLQEQGLIGPYLGGQRRDILLTAEEWRARVGAAS